MKEDEMVSNYQFLEKQNLRTQVLLRIKILFTLLKTFEIGNIMQTLKRKSVLKHTDLTTISLTFLHLILKVI